MIIRTGENPVDRDQIENGDEPEGFEMVRDLKDFLLYGTNIRGKATTEEIIEHFQSRLNRQVGLVPKFKSLLKEIADLERTTSGKGNWILKSEFR